MKDHKIYKYTNLHNKKVYIGRTCRSLSERAGIDGRDYRCCTYFWNAINKYGWDSFKPEILEEGLSDKEAREREIYWIKKYRSDESSFGYNIISSLHFNYSDEFREGARNRGKKLTGKNNPFYGKRHTIETRKKLSKRFTGKKHTQETKDKMSKTRRANPLTRELNGMFGKKHTQETKDKMSKTRRANQYKPFLGHHHTLETKNKLSKKLTGRIVNEITREKIRKKKLALGPMSGVSIVCLETGQSFPSIRAFIRELGLKNKTKIRKLLSEEKCIINNYTWKRQGYWKKEKTK